MWGSSTQAAERQNRQTMIWMTIQVPFRSRLSFKAFLVCAIHSHLIRISSCFGKIKWNLDVGIWFFWMMVQWGTGAGTAKPSLKQQNSIQWNRKQCDRLREFVCCEWNAIQFNHSTQTNAEKTIFHLFLLKIFPMLVCVVTGERVWCNFKANEKVIHQTF